MSLTTSTLECFARRLERKQLSDVTLVVCEAFESTDVETTGYANITETTFND